MRVLMIPIIKKMNKLNKIKILIQIMMNMEKKRKNMKIDSEATDKHL
jgi:hypothetical protein